MPRVIVAALLLSALIVAGVAHEARAQSGSYTPPQRGAPAGRIGAGSRDMSAERRIALVIGNGAYQHLARLDNPANDAELMAATLKSLGFELVGGGAQTNLDRGAFEKAIREFGTELAAGGVGLFFYAGHGAQVQGVNYLVPVSANPTGISDVDFELINAELVLRQMEAAGSKLNFVILDACRNNPFGGRGLRDAGGGLAQMKAPTGTLISYATQPGNVARDGSGDNSPYTLALVEAMRQPGLGVFEVFNTAAVTVKDETGGLQQPWVSNSPIEGTFYFLGPTTVTITPPPAAPQPDGEIVFWQSISSGGSAADFEAYLRQYPEGRFAPLARNRLAALHPPANPQPAPQRGDLAAAPQPPVTDEKAMARNLQAELKRVGCYGGATDGEWGAGTIAAVQSFNQKTGGHLETKVATVEALDILRKRADRVCPAPSLKQPPSGETVQQTPPTRAPAGGPTVNSGPAFSKSQECFSFNQQTYCR